MPLNLHDSTPLYLQIIDEIKSKIASRDLKPGDQLGSHAELAATYHVSLITVKKALATMIQEGILYSRVGKGTYVAQQSNGSASNGHLTIGLVLQDLRSPFFSRVMHSVEDAAYELGYHVLVSSSSGKAEKEDEQIARFRKYGVHGMIIASMSHKYQGTPFIRKMAHEGFPFVMVSYISDERIPFVGSDHRLGGRLATEYLIRQGYERIGYIGGERGNLVGELRRQGYEDALKAHNRKVDARLLYHLGMKGEWHDYESGYELGKKFRRFSPAPDALFLYNDLAALGFEDAILEMGLRIPDDVALVGFDDIERGEYASVPLTTVRQRTDAIGKQAVEMLVRLIAGKPGLTRRVIKPELVVRQSSGRKRKRSS